MANQLLTKRRLQQASVRYGILLVLLLGVGGYYGYTNYQEYQSAKTALVTEQDQLNDLKGSADKEKRDFIALKKDLDTQNSGVNQSIEKILPSNEDFTNLARELDKYFLNSAGTTDAMFLSDLRFSQPKVDKAAEFGVLPFNISISGNEDGLKNFLNYVEGSGDLNSNSRLLQVGNINFSYQNDTKSTSQNSADGSADNVNTTTQPETLSKKVTATLNMSAFFQKPLEDNSTSKK